MTLGQARRLASAKRHDLHARKRRKSTGAVNHLKGDGSSRRRGSMMSDDPRRPDAAGPSSEQEPKGAMRLALFGQDRIRVRDSDGSLAGTDGDLSCGRVVAAAPPAAATLSCSTATPALRGY